MRLGPVRLFNLSPDCRHVFPALLYTPSLCLPSRLSSCLHCTPSLFIVDVLANMLFIFDKLLFLSLFPTLFSSYVLLLTYLYRTHYQQPSQPNYLNDNRSITYSACFKLFENLFRLFSLYMFRMCMSRNLQLVLGAEDRKFLTWFN